jgi:hypothetical protein
MFNVKNSELASNKSGVVYIDELRKEKLSASGWTIFAKCSDGRTRMCHLYRYGDNDVQRIDFACELLRVKTERWPVIFEAFGGFSVDRWFGSFEVQEESELDLALKQAFDDMANLA